MAFWGVEVKPGKPVIQSCLNTKRLRITQATLGIGNATEKTLVQCSVGRKNPVILCSLLPNISESCRLELEFDESYNFTFSVIGPQTVHLTGYYVLHNQTSSPGSDLASFGISIEGTEPDSDPHREEDRYEDSFIDDSEIQVLAPTPRSSRRGKRKTKEEKLSPKQSKKKLVIESDHDHDHELQQSENVKITTEVGVIETSCEQERYAKTEDLKKEIPQEMEPQEVGDASNHDAKDMEAKNDVTEDLPINDVKLDIQEENLPVSSGKDHSQEDTTVVVDNVKTSSVVGEEETHTAEITLDLIQPNESMNVEDNHELLPAVVSSENDLESKKMKAIDTSIGTLAEDDAANIKNTIEDRMIKQELEVSDKIKKDLPTDALNHDEGMVDADVNSVPDSLPMDSEGKKRTLETQKTSKQKKSKSETDVNSGTSMCNVVENEENAVMNEQEGVNEMRLESKSLPNGLVIEELAKGNPKGRRALPGRKVKLLFTAMLKENGFIFDSTDGKSPCKFHLGNEEVIDGFNMGIEGMRVGDKRRIIIPPSLGFGEGFTENVPPNSWLVYDVELVAVQR